MSESVTDSKKPDYLEVDEVIPGQNYVGVNGILAILGIFDPE